jgi:hypothetical protein
LGNLTTLRVVEPLMRIPERCSYWIILIVMLTVATEILILATGLLGTEGTPRECTKVGHYTVCSLLPIGMEVR